MRVWNLPRLLLVLLLLFWARGILSGIPAGIFVWLTNLTTLLCLCASSCTIVVCKSVRSCFCPKFVVCSVQCLKSAETVRSCFCPKFVICSVQCLKSAETRKLLFVVVENGNCLGYPAHSCVLVDEFDNSAVSVCKWLTVPPQLLFVDKQPLIADAGVASYPQPVPVAVAQPVQPVQPVQPAYGQPTYGAATAYTQPVVVQQPQPVVMQQPVVVQQPVFVQQTQPVVVMQQPAVVVQKPATTTTVSTTVTRSTVQAPARFGEPYVLNSEGIPVWVINPGLNSAH